MAKISEKYICLIDDWARATHALIAESHPTVEIKPSFIIRNISVLFDSKLKPQVRDAIKSYGSLFEYHHDITATLDDTAGALKAHAAKTSLVFSKLRESYLVALSNSDTFDVPDWTREIDFSKQTADVTKTRKDPNMKLPQKVLDDWKAVIIGQMEASEVAITPDVEAALIENLLMIRANFGKMTAKQFDAEANEETIKKVLGQITGEPHRTIARHMVNTF